MLCARLPSANKLRAGYPALGVCHGRGSWAGQKFAGRTTARDGCGGSIGGLHAAAPGARIGQRWPICAPHCFQALSAGLAGQVARLKSHGMVKALIALAFGVAGRSMASYPTRARVIAQAAQAVPGRDRARGGWSPLWVAAPLPYPGRAGQTQDLEKPAQGPAFTTGCIELTREQARKVTKAGAGSGVGPAMWRKNSLAAAKQQRGQWGLGIRAGFAGHFQLNRGKIATLGGVPG